MLILERVMGIEPTRSAWEADILPLNYTRVKLFCKTYFITFFCLLKGLFIKPIYSSGFTVFFIYFSNLLLGIITW